MLISIHRSMDLNASNSQLDFPILYGIARQGIVVYDPKDAAGLEVESGGKKRNRSSMGENGLDIKPLFDTIINHVKPYPDRDDEPLQFQISTLAYDDYIGRLGIGRITKGCIKKGQSVSVTRSDGSVTTEKIGQVFIYRGLKRVAVDEAGSGDIVVVSGISDISIGETICELDNPDPMDMISIEEPTLSMNFMVNSSPFAGKVGKFVTSRHIRERLRKELEVNVGMKVEETDSTDCFKVSGRGELHLSVLIENMRREGYELAVSKPEVILKKGENGRKLEPMEEVIVDVPDEYSGTVISKLNIRKGMMNQMTSDNGYTHLEFIVPTRGLLGYRTEFINDTRGEGTMVRRFEKFGEYAGDIPQRVNGVAIAQEEGVATPYALFNIGERVQMFIEPGTKVYEGMIVGMPDIDIDFCYERRGEVIDYVIEKYGEDKVAQIITFGTMKARAAIRDVGRVLNVSYAETDVIAKSIPSSLKMTIDKALKMNPNLEEKYENDKTVRKVIDTSKAIEGMR